VNWSALSDDLLIVKKVREAFIGLDCLKLDNDDLMIFNKYVIFFFFNLL
jgi:hypothetical protein